MCTYIVTLQLLAHVIDKNEIKCIEIWRINILYIIQVYIVTVARKRFLNNNNRPIYEL